MKTLIDRLKSTGWRFRVFAVLFVAFANLIAIGIYLELRRDFEDQILDSMESRINMIGFYEYPLLERLVPSVRRYWFVYSLGLEQPTDKDIAALSKLSYVREVWLEGEGVSDEHIRHLASLPLLRLSLEQTSVTAAGISDFKRRRPNCEVFVQ